jgi:hypothetical protein
LGRIGRLSPSKLEEEGQPAAAGSGRARTDEGRRGSTRARTEGLGGSLLPRAARRAEDPAATRRRRREAWRVCLGLGGAGRNGSGSVRCAWAGRVLRITCVNIPFPVPQLPALALNVAGAHFSSMTKTYKQKVKKNSRNLRKISFLLHAKHRRLKTF